MLTARSLWRLLRTTYAEWNEDGAWRLAAALSYYTALSLSPLLLLVISVAGMVFGREAVQGRLLGEISTLTGRESAAAIQELLAQTSRPEESLLASAIGIATLLFGAAGVAWELKQALNTIWDVPPNPNAGLGGLARSYATSLALVLALGFVLIVSLAANAGIAAVNAHFQALIPGSERLWLAASFLVSLAVLTLLFALMFKWLPDARVRWRDVWAGALATAILFEIGKLLLGVYIGRAGIGSAYGGAASFVIVLVWIYYAAQIVFFGAEFTQVYARDAESARHASPGRRLRLNVARSPGKRGVS